MLIEIRLGTSEYFDNDYFAYNEDLDLAYRARLDGWNCLYVPSAIIYHHHSATAGKFSEFKVYQGERNRIWTLIKNYPIENLILAPIYFTPKKFILHFLASRRKNRNEILYVKNFGINKLIVIIVKAWIDSIKYFPKMIKKRKKIQKSKKVNNKKIKKWFVEFFIY